MRKKLPGMTVEQRESDTPHTVPEPDMSAKNMNMQLQEALVMNHQANLRGWPRETLKILRKYMPIDTSNDEMVTAVSKVTGFNSWSEVSEFVIDDLCLEFFNMCLRYCLKEGQSHQEDHDFIDGTGIGYVNAYTERLKVTLEQCFDAKYYYKIKRPLEHAIEEGFDLIDVANAIHPGHWAYPAGHGTKFLTAVEVLNEKVFNLDTNCYRELLLAASVLAMGRSGNLIHYPQDNIAGIHLTRLEQSNA